MKPANFPERKRQRQLRALERGPAGVVKADLLVERTAKNRRDVRTKKDRRDRAKFTRGAA